MAILFQICETLRNISETEIASESNPPGLFLKSIMKPEIFSKDLINNLGEEITDKVPYSVGGNDSVFVHFSCQGEGWNTDENGLQIRRHTSQ